MAQLFTVYFPNYCFEVQEEFSITFPNANTLPFTVDVSDKGVPNVRDIDYTHYDSACHRKWSKLGLKSGLRISAIDGTKLTTEMKHGMDQTVYLDPNSKSSPMTTENLMLQIIGKGQKEIEFTFIEYIPSIDDGEPLGLQWNDSMQRIESHESVEEMKQSQLDIPKSAMSNGANAADKTSPNLMPKQVHFADHKSTIRSTIRSSPRRTIPEDAISVSSYREEHPPSAVRLNHPTSYWRPSVEQEQGRNLWISVDLGRIQIVGKIQIQGSQVLSQ